MPIIDFLTRPTLQQEFYQQTTNFNQASSAKDDGLLPCLPCLATAVI